MFPSGKMATREAVVKELDKLEKSDLIEIILTRKVPNDYRLSDNVKNLIESENQQDTEAETVENIETAVSEYLTQVVETIPEYAIDIASTIVDSVPDVASEMVELLQDADAFDSEEMSESVDDKPEEDLLEKQLSDAVQTQTDSLNQD